MADQELTESREKLPRNICLLSGNVLKLIACVFMVCDHVGFMMFPAWSYPELAWLRYVGRLAFPIFCYMLAEGAYYTKHPKKHLALLAGFALVMQVVLWLAMDTLDFTVFVIFTFSVILIRLSDFSVFFFRRSSEERSKRGRGKDRALGALFALLFLALLFALYYACYHTKNLAVYFDANYGFPGIVLPLLLYWFRRYFPLRDGSFAQRAGLLLILAGGCVAIWLLSGPDYQWLALFSLPLLALYSGKRGKARLKYFFYLFYPLHMVVIAGIAMLLGL